MRVGGFFSISPIVNVLYLPFYIKETDNQAFLAIADAGNVIESFTTIDLENIEIYRPPHEMPKRTFKVGDMQFIGVRLGSRFVFSTPDKLMKSLKKDNSLYNMPLFARAEFHALVEGRKQAYQHRLNALSTLNRPENRKFTIGLEKFWWRLEKGKVKKQRHVDQQHLKSSVLNVAHRNSKNKPVNRGINAMNTYQGVDVEVDDTDFVRCQFIDCNLIYKGGNFYFDGCEFSSCRARLVGKRSDMEEFVKWISDQDLNISLSYVTRPY